MHEQTEYIGFEASEFADNPEPRVPCVLLLDISASMTGEPISELNNGLLTLKESLLSDTLASRRAEIAIVTFGGTVEIVQDFVTVDRFNPPRLIADGNTPMGSAIQTGIELVAARKQTYQANGISYYRPWIFLITDGEPTDSWQPVAQQVRQGEEAKSFVFFAVGVEGARMGTLARFSLRPPLKLRGVNFRELFVWLSQSMQSVSRSSTTADKISLPQLNWTEI